MYASTTENRSRSVQETSLKERLSDTLPKPEQISSKSESAADRSASHENRKASVEDRPLQYKRWQKREMRTVQRPESIFHSHRMEESCRTTTSHWLWPWEQTL